MKEYLIVIKTESPLLLGSAEGKSSIIDTDIVYDKYGLPYFPARRLKGLLRESAKEVKEMLSLAKIRNYSDEDIDEIFGKKGSFDGPAVVFKNLYLKDYFEIIEWLKWGFEHCSAVLSKDTVLETFTEIRQCTAINEHGIADEGSLRTIRVLKPEYVFQGVIQVYEDCKRTSELLALACANLRHVGSKRTRGLGEVFCTLWDKDDNLTQEAIESLKRGSYGV